MSNTTSEDKTNKGGRSRRESEERILEDARTKRAYLAHMRHELRTPINAIIGYSELLLEDAEECGYQDFVGDLNRILTSGRQLLDQVSALLDPAAIEKQENLDLEQFGVEIRHALRTPVTTVVGYAEMLMEDGEERRLEDFVADLDKIHTSARNMLEYISDIIGLTCLDRGDLRHSRETQKVVQVMDAIQPLESAEFAAIAGGRVLVVDDNPTNRQLLRRRLSRQGHQVTEAENGRVALETLRANPDFDAVLLDLIMPELNGFDALLQIKADAALRHLPVIMLSSLDEIDTVVSCIEMGAEEYLHRPINPVILQTRLGACLEKKRLSDREREYLEQIRVEKEKSERLLLNILPGPIAERLKAGDGLIVDSFPDATVLFADIVGFTKLSAQLPARELIDLLNAIFSTFDRLAARRGLEKIKTIGDAYMVAAGLVDGHEHHAEQVAGFGLEMLGALKALNAERGQQLHLRVGVNTGPVIAGVIGESKFIYDLWGDTVNTASRMESHGEVDRVHVTAATRSRLQHDFAFEPRGVIPVKGKGEMETFFLTGRRA